MRRTIQMLLTLSAAISAVSCAGLRRAAKEPVEISLDASAGELLSKDENVNISITAEMPERYRNANTGILFVPELVSADRLHSADLTKALAEGKIHNMYDRRTVRFKEAERDRRTVKVPYTKYDSTAIRWTGETPYKEWMSDCNLIMKVYAESYDRQVLLTERAIPIKVNVNEPATAPEVAEVQQSEEPEDNGPYHFKMFFRQDSADLSEDADTGLLKEAIRKMTEDPDVTGYHFSVTVSNSPEGTLSHNKTLGIKRKDAVLSLIAESGADTSRCDVIIIDENWDGLAEKTEGLIPDSSSRLRKIIDTNDDPDIRESEIRRQMHIDWLILRKIIYPELRYCLVTLEITKN